MEKAPMIVPVEINTATPDAVKTLIRGTVQDQLNDVRSMMLPPNSGCCSFAAVATLVNLISGMSTIFYDQYGGSGARFKNMLRDFYPWDLQPPNNASPDVVIACLYDTLRNPLAHSLAVQTQEIKARPSQPKHVVVKKPSRFGIGKPGLAEDLLEQLERSPTPPASTLTVGSEGLREIRVDGLYWGVRKMLSRLSDDAQRMQNSATLLAPLYS
jgi:hypothetical protein